MSASNKKKHPTQDNEPNYSLKNDPPARASELNMNSFKSTKAFSQYYKVGQSGAKAYKKELASLVQSSFENFVHPTKTPPASPYIVFGINNERFKIVSIAVDLADYQNRLYTFYRVKDAPIDPYLTVLVQDLGQEGKPIFLAYPGFRSKISTRDDTAKNSKDLVLNEPVYESELERPFGYHRTHYPHGIYTYHKLTARYALLTIANLAMKDRTTWPVNSKDPKIAALYINSILTKYTQAIAKPDNYDFSTYFFPFGNSYLPYLLPQPNIGQLIENARWFNRNVFIPDFKEFNGEFTTKFGIKFDLPPLPTLPTTTTTDDVEDQPAPILVKKKKQRTNRTIDDPAPSNGLEEIGDELILPMSDTPQYSTVIASCIDQINNILEQHNMRPPYSLPKQASSQESDALQLGTFLSDAFSGGNLSEFLDEWKQNMQVTIPHEALAEVRRTKLKSNANVQISKLRRTLLEATGLESPEDVSCPTFVYAILAVLYKEQLSSSSSSSSSFSFTDFYHETITNVTQKLGTPFGYVVFGPRRCDEIPVEQDMLRDYNAILRSNILTAHMLLNTFSRWFREYENKTREYYVDVFANINKLLSHVEEMKKCVEECSAQNERLSQSTDALRSKQTALKTQCFSLKSENAVLKETLEAKDKRIEELERLLDERKSITSSSSSFISMPTLPKPTPVVQDPKSELISSQPIVPSSKTQLNKFLPSKKRPTLSRDSDSDESGSSDNSDGDYDQRKIDDQDEPLGDDEDEHIIGSSDADDINEF